MKLAIGCDHAGYDLKETIKRHLEEQGYEMEDHGTNSADSTDYPEYAHAVASSVSSDCLADMNGDTILDLADLTAFIMAFTAQEFAADVADPIGIYDLADLTTFVQAFLAGCP